jgi:hypothetical protein
MSHLVKITYFFIFLPYLSMGLPLGTDVQLFAGIFASLYIVINLSKIKFSRTAAFMLIFSIIAIIWTISTEMSSLLIIKTLSYPYALIIYVFVYNTLNENNIKTVKTYAAVYLTVIVFQLMYPSLYVQIFSTLLRAINVPEIDGSRGVSALTTEPSFTAFILFIFLIILNYSVVFKKTPRKSIYSIGLFVGILLTKAVSGIIMLVVFLAYEVIKKISMAKTAVLLIVVIFIILIEPFALNQYRGISFIINAVLYPQQILYEGSLFVRVYALSSGFISLIYNPFGNVLGTFNLDSIKAATDVIYYGNASPGVMEALRPGIGMPSTLGVGLLRFGVVYLLFYILLFLPILLKKHTPLIVKILIFVFTVQSYSFAYPLLWLLVVMTEKGFWVKNNQQFNPKVMDIVNKRN